VALALFGEPHPAVRKPPEPAPSPPRLPRPPVRKRSDPQALPGQARNSLPRPLLVRESPLPQRAKPDRSPPALCPPAR
jgi:hypothetical protein